MVEVFILAVALSMDAFAVSVGLGAKKDASGLGLKAGLYFGIFQALMPFIGYLGGRGVLGWIAAYAHWIAFGLLALIGAKMIYEAFQEGVEEDISALTHKMMLILAIATSVDAMAAGSASPCWMPILSWPASRSAPSRSCSAGPACS